VELWVNGRSQGVKFNNPAITPAGGLVWLAAFRAGENHLEAVGYVAGGVEVRHAISQTLAAKSSRPAAGLQSWVEPIKAPEGAETAVRVLVQLVDEQETPLLGEERRVRFTLQGPGALWVNQGVPDGSYLVETANGRAAALVINPEPTNCCLATAAGLPPQTIPCYLTE
jgi:hypothetical protein